MGDLQSWGMAPESSLERPFSAPNSPLQRPEPLSPPASLPGAGRGAHSRPEQAGASLQEPISQPPRRSSHRILDFGPETMGRVENAAAEAAALQQQEEEEQEAAQPIAMHRTHSAGLLEELGNQGESLSAQICIVLGVFVGALQCWPASSWLDL